MTPPQATALFQNIRHLACSLAERKLITIHATIIYYANYRFYRHRIEHVKKQTSQSKIFWFANWHVYAEMETAFEEKKLAITQGCEGVCTDKKVDLVVVQVRKCYNNTIILKFYLQSVRYTMEMKYLQLNYLM